MRPGVVAGEERDHGLRLGRSRKNAVVLPVRREESLIAVVNLIVMPMTFLSTAFMPRGLVPDWVAAAVAANPVNWVLIALAVGAVVLARASLARYRRTA
jgi:hypothetical protein